MPAWCADYLTREQAQQALFPQAERFIDASIELNPAQQDRISKLSGVKQRWNRQQIWRAERAGGLLGWFVIDEVVGKHEFVTYAAGLSPEGHVVGIEILTYRETYGFQVRDAQWRAAFRDKTARDRFKLGDDIPLLTGATLSCRNVANGVKRLLALQQVVLARVE